MKKHHQFGMYLPTYSMTLLRLAIFVFLGLCAQTVFAQSKCVKDDDGILLCDLSISLIEELPSTDPKVVLERAWYPTPTERRNINHELRDFSEVWCKTTLGKSRIRNISVLRGYKKSFSDVALYKNEGRSYSYVGTFTAMKPSIVAYYGSYYADEDFDRFLGRVIVHEFSHAVLKTYDEYREFGVSSSDFCGKPLESDNPRQTMMNDHRRYSRYSHPDDYAGTPIPSTAQYRCHGKSAWEVLLQPTRCDSILALEVNAAVPRQDYFAQTETCAPAIPSIEALRYPDAERAVSECIAMTRSQSNIRFLSGSENIVMVIDSAIDETNKRSIGGIVSNVIGLLAQHVDIEAILHQNLVINQDTVEKSEKRLALLDFNDTDIPDLKEVTQNQQALEQQLVDILENDPLSRDSINQNLNSVRTVFRNGPSTVMNDHNVVIVISDTSTSPSASALDFFQEKNIPVNVIAIGERFNLGLNNLAAETGGDYYTITPRRQREVFSNAIANSSAVGYMPRMTGLSDKTISLDGPSRNIESVPEGVDLVIIGVKAENGSLDDVVVIPPSGPSPVNQARSSEERLFISANSPSGQWEVVITGSGTVNYKFSILNSLSLNINAGTEITPLSTPDLRACLELSDPVQISACLFQSLENTPNPFSIASGSDVRKLVSLPVAYPAPVMLSVRIHGRLPVLGATVDAEITTPDADSMPIKLSLLDDGEAPDSRAGDGIYSGALKDYSGYGSGVYSIKVIASNPDGEAMFDDTGIATFGPDPLEVPRSALQFEIVSYHQAEVIVPTPNPAAEGSARGIRTDGTLNWGAIENSGHTNQYRFVADSTGEHYIQTSNLMSYDDTAMATRLRLHEVVPGQDDPSYLEESVAYRGTNVSHIARRLDQGQSYLVSVSHANNGTGVYGLTVSSSNDLLSAHELGRASISGSSGGGGGGGFAEPLLLMFLIIAFVVLYNRRRNRQNAG